MSFSRIKYSNKYKDVEECCICCVKFKKNEKVYKTRCEHLYHFECIYLWLSPPFAKDSCPICRSIIKINNKIVMKEPIPIIHIQKCRYMLDNWNLKRKTRRRSYTV